MIDEVGREKDTIVKIPGVKPGARHALEPVGTVQVIMKLNSGHRNPARGF